MKNRIIILLYFLTIFLFTNCRVYYTKIKHPKNHVNYLNEREGLWIETVPGYDDNLIVCKYKNGKKKGVFRGYSIKEKYLFSKGKFKDGKKNGKFKTYIKSHWYHRRMVSLYIYKDDKPIKYKKWDPPL